MSELHPEQPLQITAPAAHDRTGAVRNTAPGSRRLRRSLEKHTQTPEQEVEDNLHRLIYDQNYGTLEFAEFSRGVARRLTAALADVSAHEHRQKIYEEGATRLRVRVKELEDAQHAADTWEHVAKQNPSAMELKAMDKMVTDLTIERDNSLARLKELEFQRDDLKERLDATVGYWNDEHKEAIHHKQAALAECCQKQRAWDECDDLRARLAQAERNLKLASWRLDGRDTDINHWKNIYHKVASERDTYAAKLRTIWDRAKAWEPRNGPGFVADEYKNIVGIIGERP